MLFLMLDDSLHIGLEKHSTVDIILDVGWQPPYRTKETFHYKDDVDRASAIDHVLIEPLLLTMH